MKKILLLTLFCAVSISAQNNSSEDTWNQLKYFSGSWKGTSEGKAGTGWGERSYEFVMNENYLYARNVMQFQPKGNQIKGDVHEDWAIYSIDSRREKYVLRQFNIEGFVNQFTLDSISVDGKEMYWNTESSENAPPGLNARLIYVIKDDNEFEERFELGFAGKEFSCMMTNTWKRQKINE